MYQRFVLNGEMGCTSELRVRLVPLNRFKPSSKIFLLTVPRRYFFCAFLSCVCHFFTSVHSCLVVTCWKRADLLAFVCDFVIFPCGILDQMWYLIVSIPDLCHLSYFAIVTFYVFTVLFILYLASCLHTIIWHKSGRSLIQPYFYSHI